MIFENIFQDLLREDIGGDVLVTYGGRFHPPHKGHVFAFKHLQEEFAGYNIFLTTSNKQEPLKSPFTFEQKVELFEAAGIPSDKIIQVRNNYNPVEIKNNFDNQTTKFIVAVSSKDMEEGSSRFMFMSKKDGSPSYLQPFQSIDECDTMNNHGYVYTVPTIDFNVGGTEIKSASEIRNMFIEGDDSQREGLLRDLYPNYTPEVMNIFKTALLK